MYEKCSSELERPYLSLPPNNGGDKEGTYKPEGESATLAGGSQRG